MEKTYYVMCNKVGVLWQNILTEIKPCPLLGNAEYVKQLYRLIMLTEIED